MSLLQKLRDAGLTVRAEPGWTTRTQAAGGFLDRPWTTSIVNHWDAIQGAPANSYYTTTNRYGGLIYHIVIRRDGSVDLLGQRIAWNAGANAKSAHDILRTGNTPPARPPEDDNMTGNPYTFGVCVNYHPDVEAMSPAAYASLVKVNAVLCTHLGLSYKQVVDHAAVTRRKSDLHRGNRFPGGTINMDKLRQDVALALDPGKEDEMITKWLTEEGFRKLYRMGVVGGMSEAQVVDYWITNRASRQDSEHAEASTNVFVALAEKAVSGGNPDGTAALQTLIRMKAAM